MTLNPLDVRIFKRNNYLFCLIQETDLRRRAELMLKEADKIKARAHIAPEDVVKGNPKINFAYVILKKNIH